MLAWAREDTLYSINVVQFALIVYLASGFIRLSQRIAKLEGRTEERNHQEEVNKA